MDTVYLEEQEALARKNLSRLQRIVERTLELLQEVLEEPGQFRQEEKAGEERRVRLDTRAVKEFISALKELRTLVEAGEEVPREETAEEIRVVFEAGDAAFNE